MSKETILERIIVNESSIKIAVEAYSSISNTIVPRPLGESYVVGGKKDSTYGKSSHTSDNQARLYACVWDESSEGGFDDATPD